MDDANKSDIRSDDEEWKLVTRYGRANYSCGLKPGDQIALRQRLPIKNPSGEITSFIEPGVPWTVLSGSAEDNGIIWLREPGGDRHTWEDHSSIFDVFEVWQPNEIIDSENDCTSD